MMGKRRVRGGFSIHATWMVFLLVLAMLAFSMGCSSSAGESSSSSSAIAPSRASSSEASSSEHSAYELQERTLFAFDTVVSMRCYCDSETMDEAVRRCEWFEARFSRTREGSDVWNINHANGEPVAVSPETADIIQQSLSFCEQSGGLLDITIGAVSSLWDFVEGVRPDDEVISQGVSHVDWRCVHVDGTAVRLDDPGAMIDLGATAKGYIADDLVELFREHGCTSGVINLGGNAYVIGSKPDGSSWNVGVQDPNEANQQVIAKIACTDCSVVTSGLYERQFVEDGVRYYHILDPRTGYPVETDLISVSVKGESSFQCDALATWMFLLGRDAAFAKLDAMPNVEALLIDSDNAILMTDGAHFELL